MNFQADIIEEVIVHYVNSSTDSHIAKGCCHYGVPDVYGIPTKVCHVPYELIVFNKDVRLHTILPIGRVDCDRPTESANV